VKQNWGELEHEYLQAIRTQPQNVGVKVLTGNIRM